MALSLKSTVISLVKLPRCLLVWFNIQWWRHTEPFVSDEIRVLTKFGNRNLVNSEIYYVLCQLGYTTQHQKGLSDWTRENNYQYREITAIIIDIWKLQIIT